MAKIQPRNAFSKYTLGGFGGIGSPSPLSGLGASDMTNFRIRSDGTLVPREGTRVLWDFGTTDEIRGFWEGTVQNEHLMLAVVGNQVHLLDLDTRASTVCATLASSTGRVRFTAFKDMLYLLDGTEILLWSADTQSFASFEPYAPLYGYMWEPRAMGEVNEPLNLLSAHVRIHYLNSSASTIFYLPFYAQKVDSVRSPDQRIDGFVFIPGSNVITIPDAANCTTLTISMTLNVDQTAQSRILAAQNAHVYNRNEGETMILYGTRGDWRAYCSSEVSEQDLATCRMDYPDCMPVYFRDDDILFLGDSEHPVTAISPHYDALLAFNSAQTWLLRPGEESVIEAYALINDTGAVSADAVTMCKEAPALVTNGGVYLIRSSSTRPDVLTYKSLTASLDIDLLRGMLKNPLLYRNVSCDELWLSAPNDPDGSVLVYSAEREEWYRFTGISASFFADSPMGTVYASGSRLILFDRDCATDCGEPFQCTYVSNYCDFGAPESTRRSVRASVTAYLDGGNATLSVVTDRGTKHFLLKGTPEQSDAPEHFDFRIHTGRHRFLQFALSLPATQRVSLCKAGFYANR
ncbi:MAG: hypothetical protein IJW29_03400 [Clostridia bacterium]|nr:hypothetical protein [Clostridia bacterium]